MKRIVIVDDEPQIGEVLSAYLEREGFATAVRESVAGALAELEAGLPDLMILDITLPDGSGLDILRSVQERGVPVIMLTARAEEVDRIVGLELGADDYITKPFSAREVVARVRAVMRRAAGAAGNGASEAGARLRIGELEIDLGAHEVRIGGKGVTLTPSEFRILTVLGEHPGQVFTRAQLLDRLHDDGSIFERTLDRHINNLRKKIEPSPQEPEYVLTVYGVGYKMKKP
ncbi:MAG: response regulator transcription factor [bacterium]|nr:response regulator transcription factor [bacterium]